MVLAGVVLIFIPRGSQRRKVTSSLTFIFAKLCLWGLCAKVKVINRPSSQSHCLFVANHVGFVDIFLLAATRPTLFITSIELKETPGIGILTEMGGCLYVERRSRSNIQNELMWIRNALEEGFNVVLFPEAKSTDGQKVYPFKRTLLTAVSGTTIPIQPAVINYRKANGEKMSAKYRDNLFWYDDIGFHKMTWKLLQLWSFEVEIEFLQPVYCATDEQRHEVSQKLHDMISAKYEGIPRP